MCIVVNPVSLHEWFAGRCESQPGPIMCPCWSSKSSLPPYHDWCLVRTNPPLSLVVMVGLHIMRSEQDFFRTENCCHMDLWSACLVLTHHHLHWQQLPLYQTPWKRIIWLLFRLFLCLFPIRFLVCQELISNSHLSVVRECSPWVLPPFTRTSLPPVHHKNHLIWVDSSLMVPWASIKTLSSHKKDQPPPPDHPRTFLSEYIVVFCLFMCL